MLGWLLAVQKIPEISFCIVSIACVAYVEEQRWEFAYLDFHDRAFGSAYVLFYLHLLTTLNCLLCSWHHSWSQWFLKGIPPTPVTKHQVIQTLFAR